jgi:RNA polymerase subunit RPABC4/transcription elongation factor Spt4
MALIKCTECNGAVSDKAGACPHCGAPVIRPKKTEQFSKFLVVLFTVVGLFIVFRSCARLSPEPVATTTQPHAPQLEQPRRDPPDSFRGVKWGSALPSVRKLRETVFKSCAAIVEQKNITDSPPCSHQHIDTDNIELFSQRQNVPPIFDVSVSEQLLGWTERKFWFGQVFIYDYKESDLAKIRAALIDQYGKPTFDAPPRLTKWRWPDKKLEIRLSSDPVAKPSIGSDKAPHTSASVSFEQTEY